MEGDEPRLLLLLVSFSALLLLVFGRLRCASRDAPSRPSSTSYVENINDY
jgi:hypothetical protein